MPDQPTQTQRIVPESMSRPGRSGPKLSPYAQKAEPPLWWAFIACYALASLAVLVDWQPWRPQAGWRWTEGLLFVFAALAILSSLSHRLPLQNIIACALVIGALVSAVLMIAHRKPFPFGVFGPQSVSEYRYDAGFVLGRLLPWHLPFLWVALAVSARGLARLILRPWRREAYYGYWLLGVAALLVVITDLCLEPYAVAKEWWLWSRGELFGVPWTNPVAWFSIAALVLAFASSWLISKRPSSVVPDLKPLWVWALLNLYFATGAIRRSWAAADPSEARLEVWWPVGLALALTAVAAGFAWYGRRFAQQALMPPAAAPVSAE
ncbi:MAG: carotenoid biosynthesis protein [Verrucomicrobia bacterium]|nr:carotenoid biosynthesis protein [Verrucomicrobiota bacterium]